LCFWQVAALRKIVDLYRVLTGFTATLTDESSFNLTSESVSFSLTTSVQGAEVEYTPSEGAEELPECLQESIVFDVPQAPMFLRTVIEALHPVDEEEALEE
jgi:hypothetical protein